MFCHQLLLPVPGAQVLASLSDHTLRVWDAHSGAPGPKLEGHADRAHTLEAHPLCPRLAMSAGYDGLTLVWDLVEGTPLARRARPPAVTCPPPRLCTVRDTAVVLHGGQPERCECYSSTATGKATTQSSSRTQLLTMGYM